MVRVKFVAVLLGTAGVGVIGLLNAPLHLIISLTGLGISFSAVRDISEAHGKSDQTRIAKSITTLRRWSWFTGLLGAVITISFAPLLSQWSFGNRDYTWAFVWLSITLLLGAISKGQSAILQGTRRIKDMAKASVIGSALGLITSIPLYYWFGIKGIVPSLIITSVTGLFLSWYFARRVKIEPIEKSLRESFYDGTGMAKLGIFMTLSGFIASASGYILNAFISNRGGIEQVGLYNAGWGLIVQYTGMIFAAMSLDYFPRLSVINRDIEKVKLLVKQQAETALLIMTPLLALLIITMPLVIKLFYTAEFLPVVLFANLIVLGMPLKAVSWSMSYIYLAKGNGKLFFSTEFIFGLADLIFNLLGYYFFGLEGLGYSFILSYLIVTIIGYFILNFKYGFTLPISFLSTFLLIYFFCVAAFMTSLAHRSDLKYGSGFFVFIIATIFSLYQLNKVMDLKPVFKDLFYRLINKKSNLL
ncbi:MAG: O-antigen translocase [Bacteroidales bacterium]|nr:O-antigen translocase [Bacteroidales bacterium]MCF8390272.1 O-antigen translocase [Bacteroidales bacterium]